MSAEVWKVRRVEVGGEEVQRSLYFSCAPQNRRDRRKHAHQHLARFRHGL